MAKIDYSAEKWARKTAKKGAVWKERTLKGDYAGGLATFMGIPANPEKVSAWEEGVKAVDPKDFDSAIAGKEDKWKKRYLEVMGKPARAPAGA